MAIRWGSDSEKRIAQDQIIDYDRYEFHDHVDRDIDVIKKVIENAS